jgi:phosphate transport system substrate-binding protein
LSKNYPVAKVLNRAGYFTLPTQYNDAVALTRAIINTNKSSPNYLLQDLHNVYTYGDSRTYPLSSYSYGIIPTAANDAKMTTAKRQTLVDWLSYSLCTGQKEMGPIGYSPLPLNLVKAAFGQVAKLHEADGNVNLVKVDPTKCHNPTFDPSNLKRNYLAEVAPKPAACDKVGAGPCAATNDTRLVQNPGSNGQAPAPTGTGHTSTGRGTTTGSGVATGATGPTAAGGHPTGGTVDPVTGQVVGTTSGDGSAAVVAAVPTTLSRDQGISNGVLAPIAVLLLVGIMVGPPLIARRSRGSGA